MKTQLHDLVIQIKGLYVTAWLPQARSLQFIREWYKEQEQPPEGMTTENLVGFARFEIDEVNVHLYASEVVVAVDYRRQGIATAIYDKMQSYYGVEIKPAIVQTDLGIAFWSTRNKQEI